MARNGTADLTRPPISHVQSSKFFEGVMSDSDAKLGRPRRRRSALRAIAISGMIAAMLLTGAPPLAAGAPAPRGFASPEQAVDALVAAARANGMAALDRLFGPAGRQLVSSGDPVADKAGRARFVAAYDSMHKIDREGDGRAVLLVGQDNWPMPIPLIRRGSSWYFDAKAGEEEILNRRIGRNELSAIEVCRAFVDAERDYAARDRLGDGLRQYPAPICAQIREQPRQA
jgi:hypothetical protein